MTRGGKRVGAGAKLKWIRGKTKVIRVPESLAETVLLFAEFLDSTQNLDSVTWSNDDSVTDSKVIDLTGVVVRSINGNPCVYLADLLRIGYQIYPEKYTNSIKFREGREQHEREQEIRSDVQSAIEQLSILGLE